MPRAIWSGSIAFGLVNVPVRMFSAVEEHTLHFRFVHEPDGSPIGYEKVCKAEGRPVPDSEIVKAFEVEKGEFVYMSDEDFETAEAEAQGGRTIDIRAFVPYEEIDPIYFERTYYLGAQEGSERVYALLLRAMDETGLAAVAKFVMRNKDNLACLRVREGILTLERMHFADEIRPVGELAPDGVEVEKCELGMAKRLIEEFSGDFDVGRFRDTYRDKLCEIIRAKQRGETVRAAEVEEADAPTDLMAALRASVEAAQGRRRAPKRKVDGLDRLSKEELYELAKEADIPGRSDMSKEDLVEALKAA
ncbi:MAG TPA: Ku protein [Gaiellaceae bacterium]|nr:Ku protein [Gaiellaceae bacterium]